MQDMVDIKIINILSWDNIDFFIPPFEEIKKTSELFFLKFCKLWKVVEEQIGVIQYFNLVMLQSSN